MPAPHIHVPFERISAHLGFLNKHRFDLEIYFSATDLDAIEAHSSAKLNSGLLYTPSLSIHAPFMDLCPGAIDSKVRAATISRFNQVLRIAEALKPKCIVFHSGYEKWKYALSIDLWLEKSLETWGPLNEKAKSIGVKIAIENIFEDKPANLRLLVKEMASDNFGICFDTGHCNLFSIVPLAEWIDNLGPYLFELHLHDNDKTGDLHLPIWDGTFDFKTLFTATKNMSLIHTIEAHSEERVLRSLRRLDRLVASIS